MPSPLPALGLAALASVVPAAAVRLAALRLPVVAVRLAPLGLARFAPVRAPRGLAGLVPGWLAMCWPGRRLVPARPVPSAVRLGSRPACRSVGQGELADTRSWLEATRRRDGRQKCWLRGVKGE